MWLSNLSIEKLLQHEWFSEIPQDFWDISIPGNIKHLSLKDFMHNYGALYKTFRKFYKWEKSSKSQWFVRDFMKLIINLDGHEFSQTREDKELREYQKRFIVNCLKFLVQDKENAWYIHSATSTGKTVIFWEIVRHIHTLSPDSKILIVVSGTEALSRAKKEFEDLWIDTGIYYSKEKNLSHTITIITRESLNRSGKEKLNPDSVSLMICDEIHDGFLGEVSKETLDRFRCKKIGFTATPELKDKHVEELFKKNIGQYLIDEGQRDGYLPQVNDKHRFGLPDTHFEVLKKQGDDYSETSLQAFQVDDVFPQVLDFLKDWAGKGKQFALFMPSVASSKRVVQYMQAREVTIAHLDGYSSRDEVRIAKEDFESGKIQVITSCDKMSQSWDSDAIDGVINLRPTLSPSKYFQIIGRALHGKEIVDWEKFPKKEVMVVDLVNSKESYKNRTLTASWLKRVLGETQKWTKPRKEKISKENSEFIREIEMYFDIPDFQVADISKILKDFRERVWISKEDFFENLQKDIFHYDTETEETISLGLISNSALWKTYSGRKRTIELSLWVFLSLVQKRLSSFSDISYFWIDLPTLEEYKNEFKQVWDKVQLNYMFAGISYSWFFPQVALHLYSYLSDENKKQVDISTKKLSQFCCIRILVLFIEEHCWIVGELKSIEDIKQRKLFLSRNQWLFLRQDGSIWYISGFEEQIRKWGIRFVYSRNLPQNSGIEGHALKTQWVYHLTWKSIKALTPLKNGVDFRTLEKNNPSPEEVQQILRAFFEKMWYAMHMTIFEENSSEENSLKQYTLPHLISDLFPLNNTIGILNDFNIASSLNQETREYILDCSHIQPRPGITFYLPEDIQSDETWTKSTNTYISQDASLQDFIERLKQLVQIAQTLNEEEKKALKTQIIHRNIKIRSSRTLYIDSGRIRNNYNEVLLSLFVDLWQALDIKIITPEKDIIAQDWLQASLTQKMRHPITDIQEPVILRNIGVVYNEETQTWEFSKNHLRWEEDLIFRFQRFLWHILQLDVFTQNAPFWILTKIQWHYAMLLEYIRGSEKWRDYFIETHILESVEEYNFWISKKMSLYDVETHLFHILESILDYSGILFRNTHYLPYELEGLREAFFSKNWETFLERIDIKIHDGNLDFSRMKAIWSYKEFGRIWGIIHEIYSNISPEEADFLKQKWLNFKSGTYPIQDILTLFCEKMGIEYTNKKKIQEYKRLSYSLDVLWSENGVTELENLWIILDTTAKTLDFSHMPALTGKKIFWTSVVTYIQKIVNTLSTEKISELNSRWIEKVTTKNIPGILLFLWEEYGWRINELADFFKYYPLDLHQIAPTFIKNYWFDVIPSKNSWNSYLGICSYFYKDYILTINTYNKKSCLWKIVETQNWNSKKEVTDTWMENMKKKYTFWWGAYIFFYDFLFVERIAPHYFKYEVAVLEIVA